MSPTTTTIKRPIALLEITDAFTDFVLSRQAMNCTPTTVTWYQTLIGAFLAWIESQGITRPDEITARYVRQYLAQLADSGKKDTTLHAHARAIRTLLKFWYEENYIPARIKFDMPKLAKKRLPVLTAQDLATIIKACNVRDKALIFFMVDSGLRRAEVVRLNWGDVDMQSGLVRVKQGKGRKDRSAVIGATARRALLKYRRTLVDVSANAALFQTQEGARFEYHGFKEIFRRLSKRTGIHITPHALRRTFVIFSLRAEMDVLHLQALGGWTSLDMVYHYAQLEDVDLIQGHRAHSPIDNLVNK